MEYTTLFNCFNDNEMMNNEFDQLLNNTKTQFFQRESKIWKKMIEKNWTKNHPIINYGANTKWFCFSNWQKCTPKSRRAEKEEASNGKNSSANMVIDFPSNIAEQKNYAINIRNKKINLKIG
ncbi:hypothetical protein BpHYR1_001344 [Brachionus plicatilis]|uniref:Uncharacterized protein n=1 Tax=Brachionus plicatilis TaxID=10195 RepID=A0A3M7RIR2_BRAPC|nr:hypothetical protein BpHYR1_001344 [Brachionus plicatilis]